MGSLRIAMFAWESLHGIKAGGLAPHVSEISEALARKGHEVHVFTRPGYGGSSVHQIDGVWYHINRWADERFIYKRIAIMDQQQLSSFAYTEQVAKFSVEDFEKFIAHIADYALLDFYNQITPTV